MYRKITPLIRVGILLRISSEVFVLRVVEVEEEEWERLLENAHPECCAGVVIFVEPRIYWYVAGETKRKKKKKKNAPSSQRTKYDHFPPLLVPPVVSLSHSLTLSLSLSLSLVHIPVFPYSLPHSHSSLYASQDYACLQSSPCTGDGFMALSSVSVNFNAGNQGLVDQLIGGLNLAEAPSLDSAARKRLSDAQEKHEEELAKLEKEIEERDARLEAGKSNGSITGDEMLEAKMELLEKRLQASECRNKVEALKMQIEEGGRKRQGLSGTPAIPSGLSAKALRQLKLLKPGMSINASFRYGID